MPEEAENQSEIFPLMEKAKLGKEMAAKTQSIHAEGKPSNLRACSTNFQLTRSKAFSISHFTIIEDLVIGAERMAWSVARIILSLIDLEAALLRRNYTRQNFFDSVGYRCRFCREKYKD